MFGETSLAEDVEIRLVGTRFGRCSWSHDDTKKAAAGLGRALESFKAPSGYSILIRGWHDPTSTDAECSQLVDAAFEEKGLRRDVETTLASRDTGTSPESLTTNERLAVLRANEVRTSLGSKLTQTDGLPVLIDWPLRGQVPPPEQCNRACKAKLRRVDVTVSGGGLRAAHDCVD